MGPIGDVGPQGPVGPTGDTGPAGDTGPTGPMPGTGFASATNVLGSTVPVGEKIPLATLSGPAKNVALANNELTVNEAGMYAVFCTVRASTAIVGGYVALMLDGAFYPNTTMTMTDTVQSHSMMATIALTAGQSIYLQAQVNPITLATGANVNITLNRIDDLP